MSKVWEPVSQKYDNLPYASQRAAAGSGGSEVLVVQGNRLVIRKYDGDGDTVTLLGVDLPDNLRLCRLVDAPEVRTAQEMYWTMLQRTRELNAQGFAHLQALAMAFGEYITAHPEIVQPME